MYLKSLEIKGFKSFPDRTNIEFPKGIICVAGPNGSGKSNILDSVRWVLGEQSIKSLRGEKLEDIIFSGTQKRSPVGFCEVIITIDNNSKKIDLDFEEIAIKRKAYRNGDSQFFLNGKKCRLKDVKEILLDTGIGKEGYSIISQGRIDQLLSSDGEQMRLLIEEASGISRFRHKKNETEKNLDNAMSNLKRIEDVFVEIKSQYDPLLLQKNKAEKYLDLYERLKKIQINQYLREYKKNKESFDEVQAKLKENEEKSKELNKERIRLVNIREENENKKKELENAIKEKSKSFYEQENNIKELETQIAIKEENIKNISKTKEDLLLRISNNKKELYELDIEEVNRILEEKNKNLEHISQNIIIQEIRLTEKKHLLNKISEENRNLQFSIQNMENEISKLDAKLEFLNENIKQLEQRVSNQDEITSNYQITLNELNYKLIDEEKNKSDIENAIKSTEEKINEESANLDNIEKEHKEKTLEYQNIQRQIENLDTQNKMMRKFDESMQGFSKGVKNLISESNLNGIIDVVSNIITVEKGYETAISSLLGGKIENVVIENSSYAKLLVEFLKKNNYGRVTFLPLDTVKGSNINYNDLGVRAVDVVRYDKRFEGIVSFLIGRNIIVDDMEQGLKISKKYSHNFRISTKDGELFNVGGSITGGGSNKRNDDPFLRKNNIIENDKKIEILKAKAFEIESDLQRLDSEMTSKLDNISQLKEENNKNKENLLQNSQKLDKINYEIENQEKQKIFLENELKSLQDSIYQSKESKYQSEEEIKKIKFEIDDNNEKYDIGLKNHNQIQKEMIEFQDNINLLKLEEAKLIEQRDASKKHLDELRQRIVRLSNEIESLENKIDSGDINTQNLSKEIEDFRNNIIKIDEKKGYAQEEIKQSQIFIYEIDEKIKENQKDIHILDEGIKSCEIKSLQLENEIIRQQDKEDSIIMQIRESYDIDIQAALEYEDLDLKVNSDIIRNLKDDIMELGNVNLDAIKEFEVVSERYEFYMAQMEDLDTSIKSIERMIKDLEKIMGNDFSNTFTHINENFQEVFDILFGGGKAKLVLSDEKDILSADVSIMVQPPGKKLNSINMLSGGEKALSAIALLFSIILCKPVPFCILDEIDAPLDDVNISRFVNLLLNLKDKTQFVIITHRRGTMQVADYMYGVTMEEKGVSKVVSLRLNEIEAYAEN